MLRECKKNAPLIDEPCDGVDRDYIKYVDGIKSELREAGIYEINSQDMILVVESYFGDRAKEKLLYVIRGKYIVE